MQGIVIKSTGSWYIVLTENGEEVNCRVPGKFRLKDQGSTNPIAVGDQVEIAWEADGQNAIINELLPRKNYIVRRATNLSRQQHIIAANMDLAVLLITLAQPRTSTGFIDRFLVTAEAYHIPVALLFNKFDLYSVQEVEVMREYEALYDKLGYFCLEISALTGHNIFQLNSLLQHKTTLFSGHSGVGKSTLINQLIPELKLKTSNISGYSSKGVHTTTFAEMHAIAGGGFIIDTPGIKELGVVDFKKEEVCHYFPEMRELLLSCKFNNCLHVDEPHCAVIKAVEEQKIALSRYESYISILMQDNDRRR